MCANIIHGIDLDMHFHLSTKRMMVINAVRGGEDNTIAITSSTQAYMYSDWIESHKEILEVFSHHRCCHDI